MNIQVQFMDTYIAPLHAQKMFHHLAPVIGGFGLKMLKKMGWQEGCPLGIHGRGQVEPIALDVKTDRSGEGSKIPSLIII